MSKRVPLRDQKENEIAELVRSVGEGSIWSDYADILVADKMDGQRLVKMCIFGSKPLENHFEKLGFEKINIRPLVAKIKNHVNKDNDNRKLLGSLINRKKQVKVAIEGTEKSIEGLKEDIEARKKYRLVPLKNQMSNLDTTIEEMKMGIFPEFNSGDTGVIKWMSENGFSNKNIKQFNGIATWE